MKLSIVYKGPDRFQVYRERQDGIIIMVSYFPTLKEAEKYIHDWAENGYEYGETLFEYEIT